MSTIRNSVQLVGYLGSDPTIRVFDSGRKLGQVSIATSTSYKDDQGRFHQQTHWHNLVAWGATATYMEKYLRKGRQVGVLGKLTHRSYEAKSGEKRYRTEIVVSEYVSFDTKEKPLPF